MQRTNWKLPVSILLASGLIALFLVANAIVSLASARQVIRSDRHTEAQLRYLNAIEDMLSTLKDAETGERGYVITGDPSYLEPYESARLKVGQSVKWVAKSAEVNPANREKFSRLQRLIDAKLEELESVVAARKLSHDAAKRLVKTNEGKALMDEIRTLTDQILDTSLQELNFSATNAQRNAARLERAIILGMSVGMLLVAGIAFAIYRHHQSKAAAYAAQLESNRASRHILDALRSHIAILDAKGEVIAANRAWREFIDTEDVPFGLQVGANFLDACHRAAERGSVNARDIASAVLAVLCGESAECELEHHCESRNDQRTYLIRVSPFEDNAPKRLVLSLENISGIKQAERLREEAYDALRTSEGQYRALADAMPQMVWSTSAQGAAEYFNRGWIQYTARSQEDNLGDGWLECLHPDDRQRTREVWQRAVELGEMYSVEYRVRNGNDGSYRWHLARGVPVRAEDGSIVRWYGTTTDVDDQKRLNDDLEQAKVAADDANRAKNEFLANISHEIRTPMNGIIGMSELLLESHLTVDQRESLELVKHSAESLMTIINDILDFSKIEARKLKLNPIPFSIRDLLDSALSQLAVPAHTKGLELIGEFARELPSMVVGDPNRLRQVILNLVGNAIKFTERGEVQLRVAATPLSNSSVRMEFQISDTGIGIPPEKLQTIFDPFTQADSSLTREYGGTGLGLSISSQLIALMGGTLKVESVVGKGSTFTFDACFQSVEGNSEQSQDAEPDLSGLKVLIIDDNSTNRRVLQDVLMRWGAVATTEADGQAGIDSVARASAQRDPYDLVIVDVVMPRIDGFTVVAKLKSLSAAAPPAIMMLTSAHRQDDADRCRALSIGAYLVKPIRAADLARAVTSTLRCSGRSQPICDRQATTIRESSQTNQLRGRILIAEDNPINQRVVGSMLERLGYATTIASNGSQAVKEMERTEFDLVLMDLQMPEMDGLEATARIRESDRLLGRRTPIVAMTSHAHSRDRAKCMLYGMDDYISKPVKKKVLLSTIERLVGLQGDVAPRYTTNDFIADSEQPLLQAEDESGRVFDVNSLAERVDHDLSRMDDLYKLFLANSSKQIAVMECACKQGSRSALERAAHSFRGGALNIGAPNAARAAEALEEAAKSADFEILESLMEVLDREYKRLTNALSRQLLEMVE